MHVVSNHTQAVASKQCLNGTKCVLRKYSPHHKSQFILNVIFRPCWQESMGTSLWMSVCSPKFVTGQGVHIASTPTTHAAGRKISSLVPHPCPGDVCTSSWFAKRQKWMLVLEKDCVRSFAITSNYIICL